MAARPAGCTILTRKPPGRAAGGSEAVPGGNYREPMRYPEAPRLDLVEDLHGHRIADPYRWLEDDDDPRTVTWTEQQDALAAEALGDLPMRRAFADRLAQLCLLYTSPSPRD